MINDFVRSYKENRIPEAISLPLDSGRTSEIMVIGVQTFDGSDFSFDLGNGTVLTRNSSSIPHVVDLDISITGSVDLYVRKSNIKRLELDGSVFDFDTNIFHLPRLQEVIFGGFITTNILSINNNVHSIQLNPTSEITGYSTRRNFTYTPMRRFALLNEQGTGLSSTEVDNLLGDLAQADWEGQKLVFIGGVNSARTSSSDADVSTLQGKGVTVITN